MSKSLLEEFKNKISKEALIFYYIDENHTKKETCYYFNIAENSLNNLLTYYEIVKPKDKILEKRKQTSITKYGVSNPAQSSIVKQKIIKSNQIKYGANSFTASIEGKAKVRITKENRYGDSTYNNPEKAKQTF